MSALLAIAIPINLCDRFGETITRCLGVAGADLMLRLSAFILLCLGVQIVINGMANLLHSGLVQPGAG